VSCANCDRESSVCISACVRRSAAVTSLAAATIFSSCESSADGVAFLRRGRGRDSVDEDGLVKEEMSSSRSARWLRSRLRLAVSWALRKEARTLYVLV
jgi:hypothetical protein